MPVFIPYQKKLWGWRLTEEILMVRTLRISVFLLFCWGMQVSGQDVYRDWNRRVCPVLDTPYRTYRGTDITHYLGTDTGTDGWGDRVSVTDVALWGRLPSWENDFGGELEVRGHLDLRLLEGLKSGSGIDRQHAFMMARGKLAWHQRYWGGFGLQLRAQPGVYTALSTPSGNIFSVPVGGNLVFAFTPELALFAGVDYYPDFAAEFDPYVGLVYSRYEMTAQMAYPETRFTFRPYGGRFQMGTGAVFTRWLEYRLGRDDDRRRLRFRENQFYGELSWDTRGFTQIDLRAGYMYRRRAVFEDGPTVAFDDTPFVSLGFSGLF